MQKTFINHYSKTYDEIELNNDVKLERNEDYLKLLYSCRIIKKPYNYNIGSPILYFICKKEYTSMILDRLVEHYIFNKIEG